LFFLCEWKNLENENMLKSKIQIPVQAHKIIARQRLSITLEQEVIRNKLTVVSAPAGFGKTTLLSDWANRSKLPICWLSCDREENDVAQFFRYLLVAWETTQPEIMKTPVGILLGSQKPDIKEVLHAFINSATELPEHVVFILDDYHLVEDSNVFEALAFLLDHAPRSLHFVLAGRGEPQLALARYRAHHELLEFHADDLRFLLEETQAFLKERMKLDLTHQKVALLQTQLEGWIAGLQLAALGARQESNERDKPSVGDKHRFIADYLSEDVLGQLSPTNQKFLLQTSILDRLCSSLGESVTGEKASQKMLETLEQNDLFLIPLDENREWYRYHHFFADFLQEVLKQRYPNETPDLHSRAARWYLENDDPEASFQHVVKGDNIEIVAECFERFLVPKLLGGEIQTIQRWLDSLPASWQTAHPMIAFARAALLLMTGHFEECMHHLDKVQQLALAHEKDVTLFQARVVAMRCNIACFQNNLEQAETLADRALQILPENDVDFRAGVYGALGDTYRRNGRWEKARASYRKLLDFAHTDSFRVQAVHLYGALADLELQQGHLQEAGKYWMQALSAIQKRKNWGKYPLPLIGWVYIRLSELYYEWDQPEEAWEHLSQGLERAELGGDVRAMIVGFQVAARLKLTEGNLDQAAEFLEQARPHLESTQFTDWFSRFERLQLELWISQDKLETAITWADAKLGKDAFEKQDKNDEVQLAVTRVLLIKGDQESRERALSMLEDLLQTADEEGRSGMSIEALALLAILHWENGDKLSALTVLERALRLAQPEGYIRLFADLGLPFAWLLQEARDREVMTGYAEKLLAAMGENSSASANSSRTLPEALTAREEDILKLMAAGLTNHEIAAKLVISPETVKKHTSHIYRKLGVHTRTEAAARARELHLLA
jgi:LuxR family maltose regulon positive regulatory protein